jgi:hypothetical protein
MLLSRQEHDTGRNRRDIFTNANNEHLHWNFTTQSTTICVDVHAVYQAILLVSTFVIARPRLLRSIVPFGSATFYPIIETFHVLL